MTTVEQADAPEPLPAGPPHASPREVPRRRRTRPVWLVLAAVMVTTALLLGTPVADGDTAQDLVRTLLRTPELVGHPGWQFLPALVGLATLHYLLAGVALRAAAGPGCRTPLGEATLVQLVATVANRLTPTGLGGAAVNSRYLTRRGLGVSEAVGAVAGLTVLGGVADALAFVLLLLLGGPLGLHGFGGEVQALSVRLHRTTAPLVGAPWRVAVLAVGLALLAWLLVGRRAGRRSGHLTDAVALAGRRAAGLLRRPRDLAVLLASSAGTTLVLAFAFIISVAAVAGAPAAHDLGGVLAGYLIGTTVGSAVPVPAGLGATEAAMVGTVVLAQVSLGHAIAAVLLFRLVTFWGPVPFGLLAAPRLRRTGAL